MAKFELAGGITTKQDLYDFSNMIYEKTKSLRNGIEGKNVQDIKKTLKEIETNLDVLRKHFKKEA